MRKPILRSGKASKLFHWFRLSSIDRYPHAFVLFCFALSAFAGLAAGYEIAYVRWWSGFKAIAPQIVTVAGAAIAGIVALWQYNRSHNQRDEQFKEEQQREKQHFRRQELQDQYVDIQNRLTENEPIIRANAALRLAQFGETSIDTDPNALRTKENNPYFVHVASQLATALYLESKPAIRKAVREGIKNLISFGKQGEGQPLLRELVGRLADANRAAKENFILALAECDVIQELEAYQELAASEEFDSEEMAEFVAMSVPGKPVDLLASLAAFCDNVEATRSCLNALQSEVEIDFNDDNTKLMSAYTRKKLGYHKTLLRMTVEERTNAIALALQNFDIAAQQVIDSRDTLTEALYSLNPHIDFDDLSPGSLMPAETLEIVRNLPKSNLHHCLLAGADLSKAHLEGADLSGAHLQGALLMNTKLYGAVLESAHLQQANLQLCRAQWVNFSMADLRDTSLCGAQLQHAVFGGAHLENSNLYEASLHGAYLTTTHLDGAHLYGIYYELDTTLEKLATRFPDNVLDVAHFEPRFESSQFPMHDDRTTRLVEWLKEQCGKRKEVERFKRRQSASQAEQDPLI